MNSIPTQFKAAGPTRPIGFRQHRLYVEALSVEELAERFGTPILVYSATQLRHNIQALQRAFACFRKRVSIHYAYKSCNFAPVNRLIHRTGLNAEVGSGEEFTDALDAGCHPSEICWNSVCKSPEEFRIALSHPPRIWHLDALEEAQALDQFARNGHTPVSVSLRIHPMVTSKYILPDSKLGHAVVTGDAEQAVALIQSLPNLSLEGLHCHAIVNQTDPNVFAAVASAMAGFTQYLQNRFPITIKRLGLGGGFAGSDTFQRSGVELDQVAEAIEDALGGFKGNIAFEPGRFVVDNAAIALGRLLAVKECGDRKWWITDINTSLLVPFEGRRYPAVVTEWDKTLILEEVSLADRASSYAAILAEGISLPKSSPGVLLACLEAGAYTFSARQNFIYATHNAILVDGDEIVR